MSLITVTWLDGDMCDVRCSRCGCWCFVEEVHVVADMARRGVVPYCWNCDPENSDALPAHVYYLDESFLLGFGDEFYFACWLTDDLELRQDNLSVIRITEGMRNSIKGGDVSVLDKKRSCGIVVRVEA